MHGKMQGLANVDFKADGSIFTTVGHICLWQFTNCVYKKLITVLI